jgi:hypothetical protein
MLISVVRGVGIDRTVGNGMGQVLGKGRTVGRGSPRFLCRPTAFCSTCWSCCFPYGERSDVPRLQQVEQKAVGRQRKLGLGERVRQVFK